MNNKFQLVQESIAYGQFLKESDYYLDEEEFKYCQENGWLEVFEQSFLEEAARSAPQDKARELETKKKRWLKYGIMAVLPGASSLYQAGEHQKKRGKIFGTGMGISAAQGIGDVVGIATTGIPFGSLATIPLGLIYGWWQRRTTDVCRGKCSGKKNECYYSCYIKTVDELLVKIQNDKQQINKSNAIKPKAKAKMMKKLDKQAAFYKKKQAKFRMKLQKLQAKARG